MDSSKANTDEGTPPASEPPPLPLTRACELCGARVLVTPSQAEIAIKCTQCGEDIPPPDGDDLLAEDSGEEPARWATAAGMIASLLLHTTLICMFMVVTWNTDRSVTAGEEDGVEVGVVSDDPAESIQAESLEPMTFEGQWVDIAPLATSDAIDLNSLGNPQPTASALDDLSVLGIDSATGSMGGLRADFAGLGGGGSGAGSEARFFGLAAKGRKFIYVVDRSGSMAAGDRLGAAKRELIRSIKSLPRHTEFYIIFYDSENTPMPAFDLMRASDQNKRTYIQWVDTIDARGGTTPSPAVKQAISLKPDAIWLLSDGAFDQNEVDNIREYNKEPNIQIHTIAFHDQNGEPQLKAIAEENGGRYRYVRPPGAPR